MMQFGKNGEKVCHLEQRNLKQKINMTRVDVMAECTVARRFDCERDNELSIKAEEIHRKSQFQYHSTENEALPPGHVDIPQSVLDLVEWDYLDEYQQNNTNSTGCPFKALFGAAWNWFDHQENVE
ncbi:unnamed protein product [Anisakis simplex]|uniref:Uncharacterized protein n=1 Tax=Anisakis simplex TaxID=6269 RepID=A0A0M3K7N5_ANISI|nr:unnamed protein product [Anisakis simplex]